MDYQDAVALCARLITMIKELNPNHPDPWGPARGVINEAEDQYGVTPLQMEKDVAYVLNQPK